MATQLIDRDRLGALTKIGEGGQGIVYRAPKARIAFADSTVYKEYKSATAAEVDFAILAAMPALLGEELTHADGEHLVSIAAWPCALVQDGGAPTGFVMPAIPVEFFTSLTTAKGTYETSAEIQHLLNHSSILAARGVVLDDAQRYGLLREAAAALAFLHSHGVCVGDISPKNLLYRLRPHPAVYFIDCDAMRINGASALPQVETPGWEAPQGEELATVYSDSYKLGLLALRLLAGDQATTSPGHLPAATPAHLRQLVTDALTNPPERRPLPQAWTYLLANALEEAQHRATATPAAPPPVAITAPEVPVVHSRPTAAPAKTPRTPRPSKQPNGQAVRPDSAPPAGSSNSSAKVLLTTGLIALAAVVGVVIAVIATSSDNESPTAARTSTYLQPSSSMSYPPSAEPAVPTLSVAPPPETLAPPTEVSGITPFLGYWFGSRERIVINADGSGFFHHRDYCPTCSMADMPYSDTPVTITSVSGDTATGSALNGGTITLRLVRSGCSPSLCGLPEHDTLQVTLNSMGTLMCREDNADWCGG